MGRCYVDTNVWIAAAQSRPETAERALAVLDDPYREIVLSDLVRLEALPKPRFHGRQSEVDALEALFALVDRLPIDDAAVFRHAIDVAASHDLQPMDALHVAVARHFGVEEFVTLEKPTKPMFCVTGIRMTSLYRQGEP